MVNRKLRIVFGGPWNAYHIILDAIDLSPSTHDEGVVGCHYGHHIDTLTFEVPQVSQVTREMLFRAGGRKSTGNREEDDLLVGPFFGGVVGDWDAAGRHVLGHLGPRDVSRKLDSLPVGEAMYSDALEDNIVWERLTGLHCAELGA